MGDNNRGVIRNRKFATQIRDMSGLRYGAITPTDIDAFMDFGGKVFVFIEAKHGKAAMPRGQRLAIERLCDACQAGGVESLLILASHDTDKDIDYGNLPVIEIRHKGKWLIPAQKTSVRQCVTEFRNRIAVKRTTHG